ncbi:hypothetical protein AXF42_Ash019202 [Apostasia shenzhenica]|uniref:Uncharacterized protein n=1 Tax=Apostasia shenzhenica TaxID=1088818 RepID=A0A2I0B2I9_9ASPA|nr:hypothetical protein AXF42_Ash019202 [Apostasia shenzhenica]
MMREEVISSATVEAVAFARSSSPPSTPAASSAAASSHVAPINAVSTDCLSGAQGSKAGSLSSAAAQIPLTSLSNNAGNSARASLKVLCRPWERGDLLRRLATFEPSNWFGKPKGSSSLACARRGWVNISNDKIECESCGSRLSVSTSSSWTPDEVDHAFEAFANIDSGHKVNCPWRGNYCADSLVQFPPTLQSALIGGYRDRYDGLAQFSTLPIIAPSSIEYMRISRNAQIDHFLSQSIYSSGELGFKVDNISASEMPREDSFSHHSQAQKLISLCGWEPRWLVNVQDCEEHSAQSARNACSFGPNEGGYYHSGFPELSKNALSASQKIKRGKEKLVQESRCNIRSPMLDCSLCGATIRVWDFLTVPRPARFGSNNTDGSYACKKMLLTHGNSAASGINGYVATGVEKELQIEGRDEAATADEGKSPSNVGIILNSTVAEGFPSTNAVMPVETDPLDGGGMANDLTIGQPAESEVGDHVASFESRGPSTRKRSLEEGGSTVDRPQDRIQQADSIEGTVFDCDFDGVDEHTLESDDISKRARRQDVFESIHLLCKANMSSAGPSHVHLGMAINRVNSFKEGSDLAISNPLSARASSVVAMDTIGHSEDEESMESVENYPGNVDDVHFNFMNDAAEYNNSNLAQQSACLPHADGSVAKEMGASSSIIEGEEVLNADTFTANVKDRISLGISGGSVGMGASHEAEIHGIDASLHLTDSVIGDADLIAEVTENVGQSCESVPGHGLMDEFVPEVVREYPHSDSQDMMSRSIGKADSGSKVYGSIKDDSIESGEKMSHTIGHGSSAHPALSCNAMLCSGYEASKGEVTKFCKEPATDDCPLGTDNFVSIGTEHQNEEIKDKLEPGEFNPIKHHYRYCPWVNGNVSAAGYSSDFASSSSGSAAFTGWQLTLDALDAFHSLGHIPNQTMQSESAASLYKDDHLPPTRKILTRHSASKGRGKRVG